MVDEISVEANLRILIADLQIPEQFLDLEIVTTSDATFHEKALENLTFLKLQLSSVSTHPFLLSASEPIILTCSAFASAGLSDLQSTARWSTPSIAELSQRIAIEIALLLSSSASEELSDLVYLTIKKKAPELQQRMKSSFSRFAGQPEKQASTDGSKMDPTAGEASLVACQLAWCIWQISAHQFESIFQILVPCVLTALDHYSPLVQRPGMVSLRRMVQLSTTQHLAWFGEVAMDAMCHILISCEDDLWPLALSITVELAMKVEGRNNGRSTWYNRILDITILDMERKGSARARRVEWLQNITPLLGCVGIYVLAHMHKLLSLLYRWLQECSDTTTVVLIVNLLQQLVPSFGPRLLAHKPSLDESISCARDRCATNGWDEAAVALSALHAEIQIQVIHYSNMHDM